MRLPPVVSQPFLSVVIVITVFLHLMPSTLAANLPTGKAVSHAAAKQELTSVPARLQFGEIRVGQTSNQFVTITNRSRASLTIFEAASTGPQFTLSGLDLPLTLSEGESFTFTVTFAPRAPGAADGSISLVSRASRKTLTMRLAGTGAPVGQLSITPATIDFGDVGEGSSGIQTGKLTATGSGVIISSATSNSSNFELSGLSLPVTIPAGGSVPFTVKFVPGDGRISSATLSFASNAENSLSEEPVKATIIGPAKHRVQLSWKASTSKHIVGYNIYRGNRSGGPYKKINRVLDPNTRFTDLTVAAGHKYYYVATAVNRRKARSKYSKQIKVVVP
jgi:hypothetical protein